MYPNFYEGLRLKLEDLSCYESPLVGFDEKIAIPKGQIRLPVQAGLKVVEVDFIMVAAIVARPWLYALGPFPPPYT